MRIGNLNGRLVLIEKDRSLDVEVASGGNFAANPQEVFGCIEEFMEWAAAQDVSSGEQFDPKQLGSPVPQPAQVFGIGLNYRAHAEEAELEVPKLPMVFTKFPSSISGPYTEVSLPSNRVDWEVELVVVLGSRGRNISVDDAWDYVAGLTVGQDLSDRRVQFQDKPPQFSMGKSYPGFSPIGPLLVTPSELSDRNCLSISCKLGEETLQNGTTSDMIFSVAELIAQLSKIVTLLPGDIIFTGTPAGVGSTRNPRRYLQPGDLLTSTIDGLGTIQTTFV